MSKFATPGAFKPDMQISSQEDKNEFLIFRFKEAQHLLEARTLLKKQEEAALLADALREGAMEDNFLRFKEKLAEAAVAAERVAPEWSSYFNAMGKDAYGEKWEGQKRYARIS